LRWARHPHRPGRGYRRRQPPRLRPQQARRHSRTPAPVVATHPDRLAAGSVLVVPADAGDQLRHLRGLGTSPWRLIPWCDTLTGTAFALSPRSLPMIRVACALLLALA